jgi:uncharacterized membrane protein YdcZ (DUF606 family)
VPVGVPRVLRLDPLPPPYIGLFLRAAFMSWLQSSGVVLLAHRSWWGVGTAFLISYLWASNSRKIVDDRSRGTRLAYGLGGGFGAAVTLAVAWWLR